MSDELPITDQYDGPDRRLGPRKRVTRKIDMVFRLGLTGLSADIALSVADASEDALGVRLKAPVNAGDEVEIELSFPVMGKSMHLRGDVCWCNPGPFESFLAGVRLRRRLTHTELAELTQ